MRNRKLLAAVGMTAALLTGGVIGVTLGNPLSSGAENSTTATTAPPKPTTTPPKDGDKAGHRGPGGGMDLEVAAKTLKLSTDELRTQLQAGKSLADIAKAQGVAKQDLIDALVKAGQARLDEAKKALPDMVAKMVDATPPKGGPGDGFGRGGADHAGPFGLDAAAKALGLSVDDLRAALKDGKTLADVAKSKGVDKQKVIDALVAQAKTRLDAAVKAGKIKQADATKRLAEITKAITSFVNDGKPAGGPGAMPGGGRGGPGGPGGPDGPGGFGGMPPGAPGAPGGN